MDEFNSSNGFEMVSIINFGDHASTCVYVCMSSPVKWPHFNYWTG